MIRILSYFFIYAFLGWCTEVVYAASKTGKFVNRGFLNGPYCPIYGFGIILVLYLLEPVKNSIFYLFLGSVLITSAIELTAGVVLKRIFHQTWWDYSDIPLNIGGYICLHFSLIWGVACLVVVDRIHPLIFSLVNWIPRAVSKVILIIFICLYIVDLISTVKSILKLNKKLELIDEITLKIREASENLGENLATGAIALIQKKEDIEESIEAKKDIVRADIAGIKQAQQRVLAHRKQAVSDLSRAYRELLGTSFFGQKRLLEAFPGLKSIDYKDALEKLRKALLDELGVSNETETNCGQNDTDEEK